jgi:hypothetical protein
MVVVMSARVPREGFRMGGARRRAPAKRSVTGVDELPMFGTHHVVRRKKMDAAENVPHEESRQTEHGNPRSGRSPLP